MPLPDFEFKEEEQDLGLLSFRETIQKVNQLNFKDVNFGAIRPGAGSVIEGSLIVKGSVEPEKLTGLGDLAYVDAVEKAKLGATIIDGGYIVTGMINASRIDTGTLSADRLSVTELNALEITAGSVAAEDITGNTITGKTVRTSSGDERVELNGPDNALYVYQDYLGSSRKRVVLGESGIYFNTTSEVSAGGLFGYGTNALAITVGGSNGFEFNASQFLPFLDNSVDIGSTSKRWNQVHIGGSLVLSGEVTGHLIPSGSGSDLGSSTDPWDNLYIQDIYSGSTWLMDLEPSVGPQWKNRPMGLYKRSSTPGTASSYEGYVYYDTTKETLVFSDGLGWFAVTANSY